MTSWKPSNNIFRDPDSLVDVARSVLIGETNKNNKSDDGEGLDAVQPKAVKKKFKDRKDKDIDNDGDTDSSDEYLHKRRKAVSKAMKEESDIDEAKMSNGMLTQLKKAYEPMRDKKISMDNAKKLTAIMNKFGDDKDILIQLMKADIPFVSQGAVTKLIIKHGMKGAELNKMMKEEVDLDEARIEDVLAVAKDNAANKHSPKGRDWGKLTATAAQKLIDKEMEKLGYAMTAGGKWIKEDVDENDEPCAECGKIHENGCAPEDMKEAKTVKEDDDEDGNEKTDAQKNDMDGDGEKDVKKKKKKKNDDEEETSKPNKIDTDPEIKTSVSEVYEKKDSDGGDENLMMALRKAVSLRGQYNVAFKDGKKVKVSMNDALTLLNRLQKEKPVNREALMKSAYKSEKHFKMALKGKVEPKKNPLDLD